MRKQMKFRWTLAFEVKSLPRLNKWMKTWYLNINVILNVCSTVKSYKLIIFLTSEFCTFWCEYSRHDLLAKVRRWVTHVRMLETHIFLIPLKRQKNDINVQKWLGNYHFFSFQNVHMVIMWILTQVKKKWQSPTYSLDATRVIGASFSLL